MTEPISIKDEMKKLIGKRVYVEFNYPRESLYGDLISISFTPDGCIAIVFVKTGEEDPKFVPGTSIAYLYPAKFAPTR